LIYNNIIKKIILSHLTAKKELLAAFTQDKKNKGGYGFAGI